MTSESLQVVSTFTDPILSWASSPAQSILPAETYPLPLGDPDSYQAEMETRRPWYVAEDHQEVFQQIETLHEVLSHLLERSRDLEPEFVKIVDRNFWDLLL